MAESGSPQISILKIAESSAVHNFLTRPIVSDSESFRPLRWQCLSWFQYLCSNYKIHFQFLGLVGVICNTRRVIFIMQITLFCIVSAMKADRLTHYSEQGSDHDHLCQCSRHHQNKQESTWSLPNIKLYTKVLIKLLRMENCSCKSLRFNTIKLATR